MFPHERSLVKELEKEPFVLFGVNSDDSPEKYKTEAEQNGITWPSFFDGGMIGGPIAAQWGVTGWPTIYVIDKKGVIRFKGLRDEKLAEAVKKLLAED